MRYTTLGKTGLRASLLGFGGIPIRRLDTDEAVRVVRRALELGVNYFDTAYEYGDSEEKIGAALGSDRTRVIIATKTKALTKEKAAAEIEGSLKRLRTDYIDLYQLHNVSSEAKLAQVLGPNGAMEAVWDAHKAGKIRHIGVTTHKREIALKALPTGEFESLMIPFSYLEPEAADAVLPLCRKMNIGTVIMKPFSGGALTCGVQCLKWVLGQPDTGVVIPGIGSMADLEQDFPVADMDWTLSSADMALLEAEKELAGKTHCRGCDYCQPCTNDIPISVVLRSYSMVRRQGPGCMMNGQYERLVEWVDSCTQCHECESRCPYELPIPDLLQQRLGEITTALRTAGWSV